MKVLFIVQGEGRGHLTQALSLAQILRREGHVLTAVMVGKSKQRELPKFFDNQIQAPILTFDSPNFLPGATNQRMYLIKSILYNLKHLHRFAESILFIRKMVKESRAELVINFYDLLGGLSFSFLKPETPLVCIAHQYLFLDPDYPFPKENYFSLSLLRLFTRITAIGAVKKLALSINPIQVASWQNLTIVPPLLRQELFEIQAVNGNYLHGYLLNNIYQDDIKRWHLSYPNVETHIFCDIEKEKSTLDKLHFHPLDDNKFLWYMAGCKGYVTTAGFESVCEAVYLGKPVFMVPTHIEQKCNAYHAELSGIGMSHTDFNLNGFESYIENYRPAEDLKIWMRSAPRLIMQAIETSLIDYKQERSLSTATTLAS